jgi:methionine biosynthesis protein MetW
MVHGSSSTTSKQSLEDKVILERVRRGSSVLDLGCGDGELLASLVAEKGVMAQGIEIDEQSIYQCVARGLSVFHDDIDNGLSEYADGAFDYVLLKESLQQVKSPDKVLKEALRVGREAIISFPNFAHHKARFQMFFKGRAPVTSSLPYEWHDTPNLRFLSILDFHRYCFRRNIRIVHSVFTAGKRRVTLFPNLFARAGTFFLSLSENI